MVRDPDTFQRGSQGLKSSREVESGSGETGPLPIWNKSRACREGAGAEVEWEVNESAGLAAPRASLLGL